MSDSTLTRAHRIDRIDWLGKEEIPTTWSAVKLGMLARFKSGDAINGDLISPTGDYPVYGGGGLRGYTDTFNTEGYCPMVGRQGALCGKVWIGKGKFYATEHAIVAHPGSDCHPQWLRYTLSVMDLGQYSTSAAQPGISVDTVTSKRVPHPPLALQRAIADFLDRETAQIDAFIAKNEELITLLTERRDGLWDALYTEAAETGEIVALRRIVASIVDGPFGSSLTSAHYSDNGTRVIRLGNIGINEFKDGDRAFIPDAYATSLAAHSAMAGDVIIAGLGDDRMPLGRACVLPVIGTAIVKADCYRVRPTSAVTSDYLAWALSAPATRGRMSLAARGSTRARLNTSVVLDVTLPLPDLDRQADLVQRFDKASSTIDAAVEAGKKSIDLARERRAALISAAVTGKIDVGVSA